MTIKLYALNCGNLEFERRSFFPDTPKGEAMRVPVPAFLVVHPQGKVLFDTGIHEDGFRNPVAHFGGDLAAYFRFFCGAGEGVAAQLRLLGLAPEDITHVVNSHFHFDHCGCNRLFTRAEIFVQGAEMRATRAARDADRRPDRDWEGPLNYRLLEGERDLFGDGSLVIVPTPGHTAGHQSLRVMAGTGLRFCLTGDACYTEEHLERDLLPNAGAVWKADEMRHSLGVLRRMRDREGAALIYGHDAAPSCRACAPAPTPSPEETPMVFFEPESRDRTMFPWDPFKGVVVPRPIGWISAVDRAGRVNLAPYSYFNGVLSRPRIVSFCSESEKDAAAFAIESGEFAWSMATWELREQMNLTSEGLPRGQSEFEHAQLATAPCRLIKAPRVAASPAAMECKVTQVLRVKDADGKQTGGVVVYGQLIGMHIDERYMKNGRFDLAAVRPIARCGYDEYTVVEKVFAMTRPASGGNAAGG